MWYDDLNMLNNYYVSKNGDYVCNAYAFRDLVFRTRSSSLASVTNGSVP